MPSPRAGVLNHCLSPNAITPRAGFWTTWTRVLNTSTPNAFEPNSLRITGCCWLLLSHLHWSLMDVTMAAPVCNTRACAHAASAPPTQFLFDAVNVLSNRHLNGKWTGSIKFCSLPVVRLMIGKAPGQVFYQGSRHL
jgi:hypothetical protein